MINNYLQSILNLDSQISLSFQNAKRIVIADILNAYYLLKFHSEN
jgi:hypothetical protein